jgi:SpoVK/Ycf46/Vps4 family AAA+-type ATPase
MIDCNALSALISSPEHIDIAIEYMSLKYQQAVRLRPSLVIFDNINALCPSISSDEQFSIIEQVKSLKFAALLTNFLERAEVRFLALARHYMSINAKLLDVGLFDTMFEMQAPSKEARYALIKDVIAPESMQTKEI